MSSDARGHARPQRPIAYEEGNWVCEDPSCGNVNYPRRIECNKCSKPRGPKGDAVVDAYMTSRGLKRPRGDGQGPAMGMGIMPLDAYPSHYGPPTAYVAGPTFQIQPQPGHQVVYQVQPAQVQPHQMQPASQDSSSPSAEGKRIAEHLLALFAGSEDPFGDASDCLASATLWLHSLKPRGGQGYAHGQGGSASAAAHNAQVLGSGSAGPSTFGANGSSPFMANGSAAYGMSAQQQVAMSQANVIYSPIPGPVMVAPPPLHHVAAPSASPSQGAFGPRATRPPGVKFEDYKERPSDFLKEFGDPAVGMPSRGQPTAGVNGNWMCDKCSNVNYPRRTQCKTCNEKRGPHGEDIVREYVRHLIEG